jgi:16S rRNA (cytidine1402-2'-O)-methyltransferase
MSLPAIIAQAAAAAAGAQQYSAGTLYVVATPIGNLADLTLRAVHVLSLVDAVACEDTRVSAGLLKHLGLHKPLLALHEHNEREAAARVIERLASGARVAYISDVQAAGHRCVPVAGVSSVVAALSVAGDALAVGFGFVGFAPTKAAERRKWLETLALRTDQSIVLFEAPHRVAAVFDALADVMPTRRVTIARELTKQFEEVATLEARAAPAWLAADPNRSRGEFVLVLHAMPTQESTALDAPTERTLALLLAELPLKQAVSLASAISGAPRNALYERALALRGD